MEEEKEADLDYQQDQTISDRDIPMSGEEEGKEYSVLGDDDEHLYSDVMNKMESRGAYRES